MYMDGEVLRVLARLAHLKYIQITSLAVSYITATYAVSYRTAMIDE